MAIGKLYFYHACIRKLARKIEKTGELLTLKWEQGTLKFDKTSLLLALE